MTVTPATSQLLPQQTVQLVAVVKDADGTSITGKTLTWSSTPSWLVSISNSGLVTGIAAGTATVTGTTDGKSGSATIYVASSTAITSVGGTVTSANGKVQLTFPSGAVTTSTNVTVNSMINPPLNSRTVASTAYDFGPSGTFAQPVRVGIKFDPAALPSGVTAEKLRLYTLVGNTWTLSPNSYADLATNTVIGDVMHFSGWITCAYPCATDLPSIDLGTFGYNYVYMKTGSTYVLPGALYRDDYTGPVNFTIEGAPTGLTFSVTQGTPYADSRNLNFTATSAVPVGQYGVTVVGKGTGVADSRLDMTIVLSAPGISFTVTPSSIPVVQGLTATAAIAITRDGVSGPITFTAANLPSGVTASFSPSSVAGNSTTMTLTATPSAPTGAFNNVVIKGLVPGQPDTPVPASVTVVSSSGFSLSASPPLAALTPGSSGFTNVIATRAAGFVGAITYSVTGLVNGLTAVVAATAVPDNMKVTFSATSGVAVGNYNVSVVGTSGSKSENAPILVTVGSPGTATVQLDFSHCIEIGYSIWLAAQDGAGNFAVINGSNGLYSFPITSGKGAYAAVLTQGALHRTFINYGSSAELPLAKICNLQSGPEPSKKVNWSVAGLGANERADISIGNNSTTMSSNGTFDFHFLPEGPLDYFVWKYRFPTPDATTKGIIRRDQNIANNGTAAPFDFNSAEAFTAVSATGTVSEGTGSMSYYTGASCEYSTFMGNGITPNGTIWGVPASAQRPTDMHVFSTGISNATIYRATSSYFHTMTSQSLTLVPAMSTPNITTLTGPYKRVQVAFTLPTGLPFGGYEYGEGNTLVSLMGQVGYFGSQTMTLAMPDLSALAGYSASFFPLSGSHGNYTLRGQSHSFYPCVDGTLQHLSILAGTN